MKMRIVPILAAVIVFAGTAANCARAQAQRTLPIAAAANLTTVFNDEIIPAFAKKTGIEVLPTYGATGLLAKQIENGAPFQVIVAADVATVQRLAAEKAIEPNSVRIYATGQLALWSKSLPVDTKGLALLSSDDVTNIAVANPKTAPYGQAAMETLTNLKLASKLDAKIVYAENISQALEYARTGNADLAFTALSLVKDLGEGTYMIVPAGMHAPISQAVGVVPNAPGAARRFEQFLLSREGQKIFAAAGYLPPVPPAAKK